MAEHNIAKPVALVTGAANRLGAAFAHGLAEAGYCTIIHYNRSAGDASALCDTIRKTGAEAAIIATDLTDPRARTQLIEKAASLFGPISVLINNASIFGRDSAKTLDQDMWNTHMAIHAEAPVFLAMDFATQLPEDAPGNIVNIIDERILRPAPAAFSYHLSKSLLWTATQTMAQSFAPNIRVNAIGPGPILPEAKQTAESFEKRGKQNLLQRVSTPDDAVAALRYILNAPSMTGQMLAIDGGEHLSWTNKRGPTPGTQ